MEDLRVCQWCQIREDETPSPFHSERQCRACYRNLLRWKGCLGCGGPTRPTNKVEGRYCPVCDADWCRSFPLIEVIMLAPDGSDRERRVWIKYPSDKRKIPKVQPVVNKATIDEWRLIR